MKGLEAIISLRNRLIERGIKDQFLEELIAIEKELKVLEIIKEKVMSLVSLEDEDSICKPNEYRVFDNELYQSVALTKEEYELLKEWLK